MTFRNFWRELWCLHKKRIFQCEILMPDYQSVAVSMCAKCKKMFYD